jgi:hypothetical protein
MASLQCNARAEAVQGRFGTPASPGYFNVGALSQTAVEKRTASIADARQILVLARGEVGYGADASKYDGPPRAMFWRGDEMR